MMNGAHNANAANRMNRIDERFARLRSEGRGGFIPFITAGDPDIKTTAKLIVALARAGADIIELGVPFSDPVADGIVIQRASERALRGGVTLGDVLAAIAVARRETDVPIILFSYFNPLLQYGIERLAADLAHVDADGILVIDLTPEAGTELNQLLAARNLQMILLVAPTTSDARLKIIAERARGFIYAVSRAGVTGTRTELSADAAHLVVRLRAHTDLPVAVGFGISTAAQVADVWKYADAAVVGSAIVREIEAAIDANFAAPDVVIKIENFARLLVPAASDKTSLSMPHGN